LRQYVHVSDNSKKEVYVQFCPSCGTTVGLSFERWPGMRAISRGCCDDPNAVEVSSHIWARSAQTGVALPALVDCFSEARTTLDGQPAKATRHEAPVLANSPTQRFEEFPVADRDLTRTYNRAQFVAKLRRLADAIESERAFTIQVAGERMRIPADAVFNIEHERGGSRQELEFQLIWTTEEGAP